MGDITIDKQMLGKPKEKYWISYIHSRIRKNKNFLGFVSGPTGSGKSWSTISICESLDPEFGIDRIVFSGVELMELIGSGELKSGSCIAFEESGVEMSNKNWQSVTNKMLNYLMQTFRHRNFILILNSPFMDFVDSSMRKLFHAELTTLGIDVKKKECKLKPQLLQYNSRIGKFYYKRLRVTRPEGVVPVDVWKVQAPSPDLIKQYEVKKREFTDRLNEKILNELKAFEAKSNGGNASELTTIQQDTLEMLQQGLNMDEISNQRDRAKGVVWKSMDLMRKKGYTFTAVYTGNSVSSYNVGVPE